MNWGRKWEQKALGDTGGEIRSRGGVRRGWESERSEENDSERDNNNVISEKQTNPRGMESMKEQMKKKNK